MLIKDTRHHTEVLYSTLEALYSTVMIIIGCQLAPPFPPFSTDANAPHCPSQMYGRSVRIKGLIMRIEYGEAQSRFGLS